MLELDAVTAEQLDQLVWVSRVDHFILGNRAYAFAVSCSASSARLTPRSSATSSAVSSRYSGRLGTPIRFWAFPYGESVSSSRRSAGQRFTTSRRASRLGRVIRPAKER